MIRTAVAFSSTTDEFDYLRRLYVSVCGGINDFKEMRAQGFTVREIEMLTGVSKSQVSRDLQEGK